MSIPPEAVEAAFLWEAPPGWLRLWSGERAWVVPGDTVLAYEAEGSLLFTGIQKAAVGNA